MNRCVLTNCPSLIYLDVINYSDKKEFRGKKGLFHLASPGQQPSLRESQGRSSTRDLEAEILEDSCCTLMLWIVHSLILIQFSNMARNHRLPLAVAWTFSHLSTIETTPHSHDPKTIHLGNLSAESAAEAFRLHHVNNQC